MHVVQPRCACSNGGLVADGPDLPWSARRPATTSAARPAAPRCCCPWLRVDRRVIGRVGQRRLRSRSGCLPRSAGGGSAVRRGAGVSACGGTGRRADLYRRRLWHRWGDPCRLKVHSDPRADVCPAATNDRHDRTDRSEGAGAQRPRSARVQQVHRRHRPMRSEGDDGEGGALRRTHAHSGSVTPAPNPGPSARSRQARPNLSNQARAGRSVTTTADVAPAESSRSRNDGRYHTLSDSRLFIGSDAGQPGCADDHVPLDSEDVPGTACWV